MTEHVLSRYGHVLHGPLQTVSVHFRMMEHALHGVYVAPSNQWYSMVMTELFDSAECHFLIFTDNVEEFIKYDWKRLPAIPTHYDFVTDLDFASSMLLMSLCQHHVVAVSTFSFWGSYLDKNQPQGGRTIFSPHYFRPEIHGGAPLPFDTWEIIEDPWFREVYTIDYIIPYLERNWFVCDGSCILLFLSYQIIFNSIVHA